jgi:hypothetical protein
MAGTAQGLPYNLVVVIYEIKQFVWIGHHHSKAGGKTGAGFAVIKHPTYP